MNSTIELIKNNRPEIFVNIKGYLQNAKAFYQCPKCKITNICYISNLKKRKHAECLKCTMQSIEMREKLRVSSKEYFSDQKSVELTSAILRKRWTNPNYRQMISKMKRDLWANEAYRKKITEIQSSNRKKMWQNPDFRKKMSKISSRTIKQLWENPSFRQKMKEVSIKLCLEGRLSRGHGTLLHTKKGGIFRTKSTYETKYGNFLDKNPDVVSFKYEPFHIEYYYDGKERCYIPDFLVVYQDHTELVEIKPTYFLNRDSNPTKFIAAKKYAISNNINFVIITEDNLEK